MAASIDPTSISPPIQALNFRVRYRLGEYFSLVTAHVIADLTRRKAAQGKQVEWMDVLILRTTLCLFIPPIFLFKTLQARWANWWYRGRRSWRFTNIDRRGNHEKILAIGVNSSGF